MVGRYLCVYFLFYPVSSSGTMSDILITVYHSSKCIIYSTVCCSLLHKGLWNWSAHVQAKWGGKKYLYDSGNQNQKGAHENFGEHAHFSDPLWKGSILETLKWLCNSRARIFF